MEKIAPYQPPTAEVTAPTGSGRDHRHPFAPKGRFGRLSWLAWVILISVALNIVFLFFGLGLGLSAGIAEQLGSLGSAIGVGLSLLALLALLNKLLALSTNPEWMQQWR